MSFNVATAGGFTVGDWVIVEIGNEAGQGQRGTRGVGGTWPAKSYPTEAQLLADGEPTEPAVRLGRRHRLRLLVARRRVVQPGAQPPQHVLHGSYYLGKAIPRSLQARITAISGNTLTLDKSAAVSVVGRERLSGHGADPQSS